MKTKLSAALAAAGLSLLFGIVVAPLRAHAVSINIVISQI
jgi:hypothetical protein